MVDEANQECRFFTSYSGVKLPFNLVNAIAAEALSNRNTFIRAYFDQAGMLSGFDKVVYGEVELSHRYQYHGNGQLRRAEIVMLDEEPAALNFDETGSQVSYP
ncbi:MAG: DUF6156 family protein [Bradyrhizobium sp.]